MDRFDEHHFVQVVEPPLLYEKCVNAGKVPFDVGRIDNTNAIQQVGENGSRDGCNQCIPASLSMDGMHVASTRHGDCRRSFCRDRNHAAIDVKWFAALQQSIQRTTFSADSHKDGEERQHDQGDGHHPGRFACVVVHLLIARRSGERVEPQAEHVERRDARRYQRNEEQQKMDLVGIHEGQRRGNDCIF